MPKGTLIIDEEAVRQFCRTFLLPYERPRILQCVARKKYSDGQMRMGTFILERIVLRFDKGKESEDKFIRELRKVEILADAGMYAEPVSANKKKGAGAGAGAANNDDDDDDDDTKTKTTTIQPEWMVPYITAFCLDEDDAADGFVTQVMEVRKDQRKALEKSKPSSSAPSMTNVISKLQTLLHQHPCKLYRWLKLDVDTKDPALIQQLQNEMRGAKIVFATETRGGYHVILEKGPSCQSLYKFELRVNDGVPKELQWITIENNSGPMLAIPGTSQGGFVVQFATEMWQQGVQ